jgi:hypothetical protein
MPEVFRKGAHVIMPDGTHHTIKKPVTPSICATRARVYAVGMMFIVKPRGSPNRWKVYQMVSIYNPKQVFMHEDLDVVRAWVALIHG